ncbi:hypothetical protein IFM89_007411, partial [Coptis chinensis]
NHWWLYVFDPSARKVVILDSLAGSASYICRGTDSMKSMENFRAFGINLGSLSPPTGIECFISAMDFDCSIWGFSELKAVYSSYLVMPMDSLASIVARYSTTISDLMNISAMGSIVVKAGDILIVPLPDA